MKFNLALFLRVFIRLSFGLVLLVGLYVVMGRPARPAYAQTTFTVSDCSNDSQLQADVAQASSDNAGDTITFSCSGISSLPAPSRSQGA
jgi:hypothetical protein